MPNRILKESINESKGLAEVSPFAQDLYKRLITYADDYGRFNADPQIMRARLYPRELDAVTEQDLLESMIDLIGVGKIRFYTNPVRDHMTFGYFPRWTDHQRIRDSRTKHPDPECEVVNDWALRRFIPVRLKEDIFERDQYTCQACHRSFGLPNLTAKQASRLLASVLHIDHIVPVNQGGRATRENLRLLCASCNLSRPKKATFDELCDLGPDGGELPQVAADCGEMPRNPIQSESNPNPIHVAGADAPQEKKPRVSTLPRTGGTREQYGALCKVDRVDPKALPQPERARIGKLASACADVGWTEATILEIARLLKIAYPDCEVTSASVVKHGARLLANPPRAPAIHKNGNGSTPWPNLADVKPGIWHEDGTITDEHGNIIGRDEYARN